MRGRIRSLWLVVILFLMIAGGATLFGVTKIKKRHEMFYNRGVLHMRSGDMEAASDSFRSAIQLKPEFVDAHIALCRAYAAQREFEKAQGGLDRARELGYDEAQAALMRVDIMDSRAAYRRQVAGDAVDVVLCDSIIAEDIEPAIQLCIEHADESQKPGEAYSVLGDLYTRKSSLHAEKLRLLRDAERLARDLDDSEQTAAKKAEILVLLPKLVDTQRLGLNAYERAIDVDPELVTPRLKIAAQALASYVPDIERARGALAPVLENEPRHRGARFLLSRADRMEGDYDKALQHLDLLEEAEGPADFGLLLARTAILVDAERWQEAEPVSREIFQLQPNRLDARYLYSRVLLECGQCEKALVVLQNLCSKIDKPWPRARFDLARALKMTGNTEQALGAYKQVLKDVRGTYVTSFDQHMEFKELRYESHKALAEALRGSLPEVAADHAEEALHEFPNSSDAFDLAREMFLKANRAPERIEDLVLIHAAAASAAGDVERALSVCETHLEGTTGPGRRRVTWLRARLLAGKGAYRDAIEAYKAVWSSWPEGTGAAHELATLHLRLGHGDEAEQVYSRLLERDPQDAQALAGKVALLLRRGKGREAEDVLRRGSEGARAAGLPALLISLLVRQGALDEAVQLARARVEENPEDARNRVFLGELLWRQGKTNDARSAFDAARRLAPEIFTTYRSALIDLQQGEPERAVALLKEGNDHFSAQLLPKVCLAVAEQASGRVAEAVELLEEPPGARRVRLADANLLQWCLAVLHSAQGDAEAADSLNAGIGLTMLGLPDDRKALLEGLGDLEAAPRREAAVRLNLAVIFSRTGCPDAAAEQIELLKDKLPGQPLPACWLIWLSSREGRLTDGLEQAQKLVEAHPGFMYGHILLADLHARSGQAQVATGMMERALQLASGRNARIVHYYLGTFYDQQGRYDRAIENYEKAMGEGPVAARACNNLAWILAVHKANVKEAVAIAEQALKLSGRRVRPEVLDTVGWIYYLDGQIEKSSAYLKAARRSLPHDPTVRYHMGMAYLKAGETEAAKAELEEALAISTSFPAAQQAARVLEEL